MSEAAASVTGNPLIVLGDKIAPVPHLTSFLQDLRKENALLDEDQAVKYVVCGDSSEVALTLKRYLDDVKMVLIGPGLRGNGVTVARMLASKAHIVMVIDPSINPLGDAPESYTRVQANLEELGVILVLTKEATGAFFQPLIKEHVLSGVPAGANLEEMSPEERAQMIDKRLDAVNTFPSLPETQRKVSALDDLDPPKKWAEAIDPDLPTKTVILRILNSARYGFRSRVETIDQAVALASAKTIREIVTACQIRQIFQKTAETTIDQFWRHSLAVAFLSKLLSLPADPAQQDSQQKTEFERYQLDEEQVGVLVEAGLWTKLSLGENDDTFTSGLLHDIGKVAMLMCLEDSLELLLTLIESEVQDAQAQGKLWSRQVVDVERFLMKDLDHQVIGGRLAEKWEVDPPVAAVLTRHHDIQEHSPDIAKLVALADLGANCLYPYPSTETQHPFPQLAARIDKAVKK
ncbi:HDOD domain-containing protein, partial [Candidatus Latescibacterota bacterium]